MLKCDFGNLHREVELLEAGEAKILHMDVMDGHFVPNLSYGAMVIERVRELTELPFEAHLMISDPARYLDDFIKAGCNLLTFHLEAVPEPRKLIDRIHEKECLAGLAINPETPADKAIPFLGQIDELLVMTVHPGFGGQAFLPDMLPKVRALRAAAKQLPILVDGGVNFETGPRCVEAGANVLVAGNSLFRHKTLDLRDAIAELRRACN